MRELPSRLAIPVDPALIPRALDVAGRLANDAADVIIATAGRAARSGARGVEDHRLSWDQSPFDWVTDTDRTLERHTRRVLATEFPGVPVVSQEFGPAAPATAPHALDAGSPCAGALDAGSPCAGATGADPTHSGVDATYRWVVNPVDGTANYLAGLPWCAYSLALLDPEGPVVGVVGDPFRAQIYAAARGRGARANGIAVRVSEQTGAHGGLVCTELTCAGPWPGMGAFAERAALAGSGLRVLGCAALAVTQVALGHAVATVLHGYRERDIAASVVFAVESGAVVLDRHGEVGGLPRDGLLVAAPMVAEEVHGWWTDALATP